MKWRSLEESTTGRESRSLRELYSERKALIARYVPPDVQEVHARAVAELQDSGIARRVLKAGSKAPDFRLPDQNGKEVSSLDLLRKDRLIVLFFRGRWCPFCVGQLETTNAVYPEFQGSDVRLVAISPQTLHQSFLMADQHHLRFPLLSDARNEVARQFGLVYRVPEYQQDVYRRVFISLPFVNGEASWELPIPAAFVVDSDGTILHSAANPDYTDRPEPRDLFRVLSQLP